MTTQSTAIIAGCARSGSTSLFQMLTACPKIAYSKKKEPHFFIGCSLEGSALLSAYEELFVDRPATTLRLEATAIYFYAVPDVPSLIGRSISDAKIILIFREPYERLISEFNYLKTRLLIPPDLGLEEYVADCMRLRDADWRERSNRHRLGVRNGYYDRYFPDWAKQFGDRLKVVFHDDLADDPARLILELTTWLALPPIVESTSRAIQNKGVAFRAASLQRPAVAINDRLEPFFRRNPKLKAILRGVYYRVNGVPPERAQQLSPDHPLRVAYAASREAFRTQLLEWNSSLALPDWLEPKQDATSM